MRYVATVSYISPRSTHPQLVNASDRGHAAGSRYRVALAPDEEAAWRPSVQVAAGPVPASGSGEDRARRLRVAVLLAWTVR